MNQEDILRSIIPYMDDSTFEKLHRAITIPSLKKLSSDSFFWHERVETLSGRMIPFSSLEDWKDVYHILKKQLSEPVTRLWNSEDNVMVVQVLISMGYNPEDYKGSLTNAASSGCVKILKLLLDDGRIDPSVNHEILPPLICAAGFGRLEAMRLLLADSRIDPTVNSNEAFWYAVRRKQYEVIDLMLRDKRIVLDASDMESLAISFILRVDEANIIDYLSR